METAWTIAQLERNTETGGVISVHWRVSATDGDYSASSYGSIGLQPDPESEDFIPFENLTEADVLAWVWEQSEDWKSEIEEGLASQIEKQKNPVTTTGLPWS